MLKTNNFYAKRASSSLILLWVGAIILLIVMLYNWQTETDSPDSRSALLKSKDIFADELLLSSQELLLGESAGLINLSLNRNTTVNDVEREDDAEATTSPERKLVYSKMLKNKINRMSSAPANTGVSIKPLPQ